jgi:hypothetical protein
MRLVAKPPDQMDRRSPVERVRGVGVPEPVAAHLGGNSRPLARCAHDPSNAGTFHGGSGRPARRRLRQQQSGKPQAENLVEMQRELLGEFAKKPTPAI